MARQKDESGINKSAMIRELLRNNPKIAVKDVVKTMADQNIKILPSQVYFIKSRMRRKRKMARKARAKASASSSNPVDLIRKVKSLAEETGGMKNLKQLVEVIAS